MDAILAALSGEAVYEPSENVSLTIAQFDIIREGVDSVDYSALLGLEDW